MIVLPIIDKGEMAYPVGAHIKRNMDTINDMADCIYLVMAEHYELKDITNIVLFCRGSSGAIIAGIVSTKLAELCPDQYITIWHIKKEGEGSHANKFIDNAYFYKSITIIVDDFIATGNTIKSILENIHTREPNRIIDILCVSGYIPSSIAEKGCIRYGISSE